uniref:Potassium channel regulatory protein unc-93 n=1 Tax=Steinernema glaseri TaxID=37863 RepID=A0A1I7ZTL9_9BILA
MDGNAWELVEEDKSRKGAGRVSRSPSSKSKIGSEFLFDIDQAEIDAEELSSIIDEHVRKESERRQMRGKSPAVESLRKVSRIVLEKVGLKAKRKHTDVHELSYIHDLPFIPLTDLCIRPISTSYCNHERHSLIPKILSPILLRDIKKEKPVRDEKCAYLFRGSSYELLDQPDVPAGPQPSERIHMYDPYCPVHGSRRRVSRRRQLLDMHSFVASVDTVDLNETSNPLLYSQQFAAKFIRKRRRGILTGEQKIRVEKARHKLRMNLWIISLAFLFLFTAFHGLQNLQTSVNGDLGADSLCAFYISLAVSSLIVPSFIINRLGCKMTLVYAIIIYILYMAANFLPKYYSLIPASVLAGIAGSCLWAAKCVYITESGIKYAKINIEAQNVVIVRFFGYFFMIVHLGQVIGNLLSSMILAAAVPTVLPKDHVDPTCGNGYMKNHSLLSARAQKNLMRPPQAAYLSVVACYIGCATIALMTVAMFLNSLKRDSAMRNKSPHFTWDILRITIKNLRRPKPVLLIPLTIFTGIEQAFVVGLYTKAFIGCGLGISQIGFVMTSFGVADAVCSLVFGPLIKMFGRMPLFVFGAVINMLMIGTLLIWPLNPNDKGLFYTIAGVWGMADGVWNTQINGFWVALIGRESLEVAFSNYRFWESSGFALGLFLTRYTDISHFLVISFVVLLIGMLGYFIIELYEKLCEYFTIMFEVCALPNRRRRAKGPGSMEASLISKNTIPTISMTDSRFTQK